MPETEMHLHSSTRINPDERGGGMKQQAILIDVDGTLAIRCDRDPYDVSRYLEDTLNYPVAMTAWAFKKAYPEIALLIVSGREAVKRDVTALWLAQYNIPFDALYMRHSGDFRRDYVVKKELYQQEIEPRYNVLFVLDDRQQVVNMWRNELGLTVFQVNAGPKEERPKNEGMVKERTKL